MKNAASCLTALLILIGILIASANGEPYVGVYYYVWYGDGRHWNDAPCNLVIDKPILGYYNSQDIEVVKTQLQLIQDAGIDFIIISWWGPKSYEDRSAELVFSCLPGFQVKACIMVEPFNSDVNYAEIYDYIYEKYVSKHPDLYFHLEGKPLLLFYNPLNPTIDSRFTVITVGHESYVQWYLWSEEPTVRNGCIALMPKYDNSLINPDGAKIIDPYGESFYEEAWRYALNEKDQAKVITIYSWNEYHDRSAIEPHYDGLNPAFHFYALTRNYITWLKTPQTSPITPYSYTLIAALIVIAVFTLRRTVR